ncbi:T9SS type A sorting domain-containing protein [Limnovirga soli]|uniref:T9SS type A sorting domain-containing protein n=1 Tax=Limnovirga soli TaxID=2656915 RepID=A0A8J8FG03_9BACT|nr:T9SS type A sorting domain-containing protein [Limnovirga soli]NNV54414.1 T9SS type A sorting domain-containing protein [Limnovirga soli]
MNKIVQISFLRKTLFALLLVMSTSLIFAAYHPSPFDYQVKIVKCYPNPAVSVINFEFSAEVDKSNTLQIYSFTGKKVSELPLATSKITITLGNEFYRGIYIFQLRDKNGKILETGKFQVIK